MYLVTNIQEKKTESHHNLKYCKFEPVTAFKMRQAHIQRNGFDVDAIQFFLFIIFLKAVNFQLL